MSAVPSLTEFEHAAQSLAEVISHTPTLPSRALSDILGTPVLLKMENLQRTGSFKIRGAAYRLSKLSAEERSRRQRRRVLDHLSQTLSSVLELGQAGDCAHRFLRLRSARRRCARIPS